MARIVAIAVLALLAAAPAAALAVAPPDPTESPFQQTPRQNEVGEQPAEQAPVQTQVDDGSIGGREALLIAVGVVALIGGIWFVISRDAKRATAGLARPSEQAPGGGRGGSSTRAARRSRRLSASERRRRKRGRATK